MVNDPTTGSAGIQLFHADMFSGNPTEPKSGFSGSFPTVLPWRSSIVCGPSVFLGHTTASSFSSTSPPLVPTEEIVDGNPSNSSPQLVSSGGRAVHSLGSGPESCRGLDLSVSFPGSGLTKMQASRLLSFWSLPAASGVVGGSGLTLPTGGGEWSLLISL